MNKIDRPPGYSKWPREDQDAWYRANVLRLLEGKVMDWNPGGNGATWDEPDMSVLRMRRRPPPDLPLNVFGPAWGPWIAAAAEAAACPIEYVAAPLLASASALIGHARWSQATPRWTEPPHLWIGAAGDSGDGKPPGADCLMRDVLPEIERRMAADHPERLREWRSAARPQKPPRSVGKSMCVRQRSAVLPGSGPPAATAGSGATVAAPTPERRNRRAGRGLAGHIGAEGLLIVRDELTGWIDGMAAYNPAGRGFSIEAYGGRPYRVERIKNPEPITIPRLAVAVYGATQPDKFALLMGGRTMGCSLEFCGFGRTQFLSGWGPMRPERNGRSPLSIDYANSNWRPAIRLRQFQFR